MGDHIELTNYQREFISAAFVGLDLRPKNARPNVQPKPGDHVTVPFAIEGTDLIAWHHGIFVGVVKGIPKVIDNGKARGLRYSRYYEDFGADVQPVYVIIYEDDDDVRQQRRDVALAAAKHCVENLPNEYHLFSNNCEHLATFCSTGRCGVRLCVPELIPVGPVKDIWSPLLTALVDWL